MLYTIIITMTLIFFMSLFYSLSLLSLVIVSYESLDKLLTNEQQESYVNVEICYICRKKFEDAKDEKYCKVRDHCHYTDEYGEYNEYSEYI